MAEKDRVGLVGLFGFFFLLWFFAVFLEVTISRRRLMVLETH